MLNAILNGGLGETASSSRSGTSTTTTYTIATPTGTATNLTLEQYNQLKDALAKYNDAYGIAYSYDLPAPDWNKFTASNAQSIVDDYAKRAIESGKTSKSESWAAFAAERYSATVAPSATEQPTVTQPTVQPTVTQPTEQPTEPEQPPKVVIPESVVPSAGVAPSEEKGNSLLIPGIILALGVIGAIALTSKSKKWR